MEASTLNELLECSVCFEVLNQTSKVLPCQHTYCRNCLEAIVASKKELVCPECRAVCKVKIKDLPTNILLVRLLESMKTERSLSSVKPRCSSKKHRLKTVAATTSPPQPTTSTATATTCSTSCSVAGPLRTTTSDTPKAHQISTSFSTPTTCFTTASTTTTVASTMPGLPPAVHGTSWTTVHRPPGGVGDVRARRRSLRPAAKAIYDYRPLASGDLSFTKGDRILLDGRVDEDWLKGEFNGVTGVFPANYVEIIVPLNDRPYTCVALYDFTSSCSPENHCLFFKKGDLISVIRKVDTNWVEGELKGNIGMFPANFVEFNEHAKSLLKIKPPNRSKSNPAKVLNRSPPPPNSCSSPSCDNNNTSDLCPSPSSPSSSNQIAASDLHLRHSTNRQLIDIYFPNMVKGNKLLYKAIYNYKPQKSDELELQVNQLYIVTEHCKDGWYKGYDINYKCGVFPGNYAKLYNPVSSNETSCVSTVSTATTTTATTTSTTPSTSTTSTTPAPSTSSHTKMITNVTQAVSRSILHAPTNSHGACRTRSTCSPSGHAPNTRHSSSLSNHTPHTASPSGHAHHTRSACSPSSHAPHTCPNSTPSGHASHTRPSSSPLRTKSPEQSTTDSAHSPKLCHHLDNQETHWYGTNNGNIHVHGPKSPSKSQCKPETKSMKKSFRAVLINRLSCNMESTSLSENSPNSAEKKYRCIASYPAKSANEITLTVGDLLNVKEERKDGWMLGVHSKSGRTGYFPSTFVHPTA